MSDNHEPRFTSLGRGEQPLFKVFSKIILQAWVSCEEVFRKSGEPRVPPRTVSDIKPKMTKTTQNALVLASDSLTVFAI